MDATSDLDRVRDYLVGRLSDEERRSFEERMARDPQLVREFEQALELREGLKELQAQGYFLKPLARPGAVARRLRTWLPLLAAAAVTGIAFILWTQRSVAPSGVLSASPESAATTAGAAAVAAHFTFVSTRGAATPDLDLPSHGLIEFRAAPGMHGSSTTLYRMTLVRSDEAGPSRSVGTLSALALDGDGYVHGYADAARLSPGSYLLRIDSGSTGAGTSEEFAFNLRAGSAH